VASDLFLNLPETFKEVTKPTHRVEMIRQVLNQEHNEQGRFWGRESSDRRVIDTAQRGRDSQATECDEDSERNRRNQPQSGQRAAKKGRQRLNWTSRLSL